MAEVTEKGTEKSIGLDLVAHGPLQVDQRYSKSKPLLAAESEARKRKKRGLWKDGERSYCAVGLAQAATKREGQMIDGNKAREWGSTSATPLGYSMADPAGVWCDATDSASHRCRYGRFSNCRRGTGAALRSALQQYAADNRGKTL